MLKCQLKQGTEKPKWLWHLTATDCCSYGDCHTCGVGWTVNSWVDRSDHINHLTRRTSRESLSFKTVTIICWQRHSITCVLSASPFTFSCNSSPLAVTMQFQKLSIWKNFCPNLSQMHHISLFTKVNWQRNYLLLDKWYRPYKKGNNYHHALNTFKFK